MQSLIETINGPEIVLSDMLGPATRHLVEAAQGYNTIILLYEDDFSDSILASWAELDRINIKTRRIGQLSSGIEIHTFGMPAFKTGSVIELNLREASQDYSRQNGFKSAYKSLLNEICLISVRIYENHQASMLLQ